MVNVATIIGGGFGLIRDRPVAVFIWGVLQFAVALVTQLVLRGQLESQSQAGDITSAEVAAMAGGGLLFGLLSILITLVLICASYRALLRPSEGGPGFMRVGMDELRMLGLFVILIIVLGIGGFILVLVLGLLIAGLAAASGSFAVMAIATGLLYLALIVGSIYLYVRLSLVFAMTLLRRKIVIDDAWSLTRGHFWKLFGAYLVIWLVSIAIYLAASLPFATPYLVEMIRAIGSGNAEAFAEISARQNMMMLTMSMPMLILMTLASVVAQTITLALSSGATATAVLELLHDRGEVTEDDVQRTAEIFE